MEMPDMKPEKPQPDQRSLIERAAAHYGLDKMLRSPPNMPVERVLDEPLLPGASDTIAQSRPETLEAPQPEAVRPTLETAPAPAPKPGGAEAPFGEIDPDKLAESGFIVPGHPPTALSEEFRIVKRYLLLNAFGGRSTPAVERGRAILVCSAHPNEGKTFCSINLALSLANERNVEVLLVDADVAKPEILSTLGLGGGSGLIDALVHRTDPEQYVIRTSVPNLLVLPAGHQTHRDTELLASSEAQGVVDQLIARNPARIVIFDCAPALAASPAAALAQHMGQVLMVVRADKTSEHDLAEAVKLLSGHAHMQLLLNGTTFTGGGSRYGSYYGYGG